MNRMRLRSSGLRCARNPGRSREDGASRHVSGSGIGKEKNQSRSARQTRRRPMPVRQGRLRDRRAGALGLARSFAVSSRRAHGAAYATYVGSWRKRFRITKGKTSLTRYEDKATKTARSFCSSCGTPIAYERPRSPHMVNIPRALFSGRTGRQPLYHIAIEELQEWAYTGEPLVPLKGYPGVVWQRSKKKKRIAGDDSVQPAAAQGSHDLRSIARVLQVWSCASIPRVNEPAGRRRHEEQNHRPLRIPCLAEGRGRHASVRQSRHHRTADHARAEGPSRPHLCDGDAGEPRRRHGRRFQPRLGQARRLQRPCRAGPRQRDGLALQRELHRHAADPDRRPAGAGPRPDGAGALRPAGADGASRW